MAALLCVYFDVFIESVTSIMAGTRPQTICKWGILIVGAAEELKMSSILSWVYQHLVARCAGTLLIDNMLMLAGLCKFDFQNCVMNILSACYSILNLHSK